jgi:hypothetical protein
MPDLPTPLLVPEKAPAIVRSGNTRSQPHEWEKIIGPTIKGDIGNDYLIYVYPEGIKPAAGWTDKELASAKSKASSRAASIATRYWNYVPTEHVEVTVRQRPDGTYGVYATHQGEMTEENRFRMARRRSPRGSRLAPEPTQDVSEAMNPSSGTPSTPQTSPGSTAAERVKAAARKQQGR